MTKTAQLAEEQEVRLVEMFDWSGRTLSAYAKLKEAQRNGDEDAWAEAWGELTSNLLILRDKVIQSYELLDPEEK